MFFLGQQGIIKAQKKCIWSQSANNLTSEHCFPFSFIV